MSIELVREEEPRKHAPRKEYNFRGKIHRDSEQWITGFMGWCIVGFMVVCLAIIAGVA